MKEGHFAAIQVSHLPLAVVYRNAKTNHDLNNVARLLPFVPRLLAEIRTDAVLGYHKAQHVPPQYCSLRCHQYGSYGLAPLNISGFSDCVDGLLRARRLILRVASWV